MEELGSCSITTRTTLEATTSERDLGIQITNDLKVETQSIIASCKANQMLGILKHTFQSRDASLWKQLYSSYIRPLLEFAIPAWNPHLAKDEQIIELIQRRATKIPDKLKKLDYKSRCLLLGLSSLVDRRKRGDLIQKYKIVNNIDLVNWHFPLIIIPPRANHRERLHREKYSNNLARFHFFNNRIVNAWNILPDKVIDSPTLNSFKASLDRLQCYYSLQLSLVKVAI